MKNLRLVENGLIPVYKHRGVLAVRASDLHKYLVAQRCVLSGYSFKIWYENKLSSNGAVYCSSNKLLDDRGYFRTGDDFILALAVAKCIALIEPTRRLRSYLTECGEKLENSMPFLTADVLQEYAHLLNKSSIARVASIIFKREVNPFMYAGGVKHRKLRREIEILIEQYIVQNGIPTAPRRGKCANVDWKSWDGKLGTMPDTEIAKLMGIPTYAVYLRRQKFGIPRYKLQLDSPYVHNRVDWKSWDKKLGIMPDREIARMAGCSAQSISARRKKLKIPPFKRAERTERREALV